ncbi:hypothetical protein LSTR_LSTR000996 [Laodelphax striatellus]|uniref:C2H2-type domain-containing protein n=1 Tax=Laodelphax striatellus TaxID=195883 RepID=A0A482X0V9_LAOST|nr:hypothetical protein LSTR_LSTR000996 [Laodelphax striatellus]
MLDFEKYACNICGKVYTDKSNLRRHMKFECGGLEPRFRCPEPGCCHPQLSVYDSSISIEEDGRFGCVRCGKSYKNRRHLIRHLKYECGREPRFSCTFCPHRSRYKTDLKTHMFVKHADQFLKQNQ